MSLDVLQSAVGLAGDEAEVHVLHVAEDSIYVGGFVSPQISLSKLREDTRIGLENNLEILVSKVSTPAKLITTVVWGLPPREITHIAESGGFDLIVMGDP